MPKPMQLTPSCVVFEGIDGSGKTTIARTFTTELTRMGKSVFDLPTWSREHGRLPLLAECEGADVIFAAEPTQVWVGAAIRGELVRTNTGYTELTVAEAFSLDRLILYSRLIIPLRARGKIILQDRGVPTSLVYQSLRGVNVQTLTRLPGNALELAHPPDLMLIAHSRTETALNRLRGRSEKKDNAVFEERAFLERANEQYLSPAFRAFWRRRGVTLHYMDTDLPLESMHEHTAELARTLFSSSPLTVRV
ncbi:hypothetical protein HY478_00905 [Candidatus Uhrbacteria bacterium]|nr:hypothetical protein [Candidatus Uhrbacteria bacterium]